MKRLERVEYFHAGEELRKAGYFLKICLSIEPRKALFWQQCPPTANACSTEALEIQMSFLYRFLKSVVHMSGRKRIFKIKHSY